MEDIVMIKDQKNTASSFAAIIVFIWMMLGVLGFVTSVVCFAYDGGFMQNWVGFLTSVVLGPFYWLYFFYAGETYCKSSGRRQIIQKKVSQFAKKGLGMGKNLKAKLTSSSSKKSKGK